LPGGLSFDVCSYLTDYCYGVPGKFSDIIGVIEGVLENVTRCTECNICDNAVLFMEMEILPNPKLSSCIVNMTQKTICEKLKALNIDGAYELCASGIRQGIGDILSSVKTMVHSNFICGTVAHVCDNQYGVNVIGCICDTVKLPSFLSWILPC